MSCNLQLLAHYDPIVSPFFTKPYWLHEQLLKQKQRMHLPGEQRGGRGDEINTDNIWMRLVKLCGSCHQHHASTDNQEKLSLTSFLPPALHFSPESPHFPYFLSRHLSLPFTLPTCSALHPSLRLLSPISSKAIACSSPSKQRLGYPRPITFLPRSPPHI